MVSDASWSFDFENDEFQSALRFAVVSDSEIEVTLRPRRRVSIRFEVRGGFRPWVYTVAALIGAFQSALRFAVVSDEPQTLI